MLLRATDHLVDKHTVERFHPEDKRRGAGCGTLTRPDELVITKAVNGWGKLHPCMLEILRNNPGFREFNIEQEGWVELWRDTPQTYYRIVDIGRLKHRHRDWKCTLVNCVLALADGDWSVCALKTARVGMTSVEVFDRPLPSAASTVVCGTVTRQDKVYVSRIVDGWAKLDPVMYHTLSMNDDFRPFPIGEEGWVPINQELTQLADHRACPMIWITVSN